MSVSVSVHMGGFHPQESVCMCVRMHKCARVHVRVHPHAQAPLHTLSTAMQNKQHSSQKYTCFQECTAKHSS